MKLKVLLSLTLFASTAAIASNGYYRFPDIRENTVVFTAEGDLWLNKLGTNSAKRLTTHTALETHPSISPDGKLVAYVANYEGSTDVYFMPIKGGVAKRLSFDNGLAKVHGWTRNGEVIYSTNGRAGPPGNWTLKNVHPETLITTNYEVADAREGVMDRAGVNLFFSQFGVANYNDNPRQYRGGAKGELWRFVPGKDQEAKKLTINHVGNARQPMVYQQMVYFISDADGVDNIWRMDFDGGQKQQVTRYRDWPVRTARQNGGKIIYQLGADLKVLDLSSGKAQQLNITLTSDFPNLRQRWLSNPLQYVTSMNFNEKRNKVALTARGKVAVAGTDGSRLVEINTLPDTRTRGAVLSHDGQWVYAINDASGEQEIWRFASDGSDDAKQLTNDGKAYRHRLTLSPDGKSLVHDDNQGNLWLLGLDKRLKNRKLTDVGEGYYGYETVVFSGDGKYLAFNTRSKTEGRLQLFVYELEKDKLHTLTSDKYESFSPAFSDDGHWLYFISERHFRASPGAPWGDRNMGPKFDRRARIFAYGLNAHGHFPFDMPHELMPEPDKKSKNKTKLLKAEDEYDFAGVKNRLYTVDVRPGNYWGLSANDEYLYVLDKSDDAGAQSVLYSIEIKAKPELNVFTRNVRNYQLGDKGQSLFLRMQNRSNRRLYIVDAQDKFPKRADDTNVLTYDWEMLLKPQKEWQQLFHDAWLLHRHTLFDKDMRGLNWADVASKYEPLLARITDRWELNDLLAQMVGELNLMHSQIRSGDVPVPQGRSRQANLGALLEQSATGVKIVKIYQHDVELPWQASPLSRPGVNVKNGDTIVAVNGVKTPLIAHLADALRNQVGKQVLLEVKRGKKTFKSIIKPASSGNDDGLRYRHWVNGNRKVVENADTTLGYLHLHGMTSNDLGHFADTFYANTHKDGLIIDVRRNRGGNIDSWLIEKLMRKVWGFWRLGDKGTETNMQRTFRGHLVVLADQGTYSDGETFIAAVKSLKLGTVIGKRTAGAGLFLSDQNRLSDFGMARAADISQHTADGRWIIEGYGVSPDIEIDNLPYASYKGQDAQLQKAITVLKQKIKSQPIKPLKGQSIAPNSTPAKDI